MVSQSDQRITNFSCRVNGYAAAGDPIPFLLDDTYYLFHLASPANSVFHPPRVRCAWLKTHSKDLVTWIRDNDPVIPPGKGDSDHDRDGAWTGSIVIGPDGNMHIFYTGYNLPTGGKQVILHAASLDKVGTKFVKPQSPIKLLHPSQLDKFEKIDFRDPFVFFHHDENRYWMLVATRLAKGPYWTRGCIALLTSDDLESWSLESEPLYSPNNIFCPECPELFTLGNGKWYLVYSRFSAPESGTLYVFSDSPRDSFISPRDCSSGRLDGRRWYAAKSYPKVGNPSKRIAFRWIADYDEKVGKWLYGGDMALPRKLSAAPDGSLKIHPAEELFNNNLQDFNPASVSVPAHVSIFAPSFTSVKSLPVPNSVNAEAHVLSFSIAKQDAKSFGLILGLDDDMRGYRITFELVAADIYSVSLVTDDPPLDDFWPDLTKHSSPMLVDGSELVRHGATPLDHPMHLMISGNVVEFFVGGKAITYRLASSTQQAFTGPGVPSAYPVGFYVEDGAVEFSNISLKFT